MSGPWIAAFMALWVVVILVTVVQIGFLRRATTVLEAAEAALKGSPNTQLHGAPPGTVIPEFRLRDDRDLIVRFSELARSAGIYLLMSATCEPCRRLADDLGSVNRPIDGVHLFVIFDEPKQRLGLPSTVTVLYQIASGASSAFQSTLRPQAFAVDGNGVVVDLAIPHSVRDIRALAMAIEDERDRPHESRVDGAIAGKH